MRVQRRSAPIVIALAATVVVSAPLRGQTDPPGSAPPAQAQTAPITLDTAVRLALERNQALRAQRLTIDVSKADEITAALKPNPNLSFGVAGFPVFTPSQLTPRLLRQQRQLRRGARLHVRARRQARQAHHRSRKTRPTSPAKTRLRRRAAAALSDRAGVHRRAARQVRARSGAAEPEELLARRRRQPAAGHGRRPGRRRLPARSRFRSCSSSRTCRRPRSALVQARATLRQLVGFDTVPDDFDVDGRPCLHAAQTVNLDDLKRAALASGPTCWRRRAASRWRGTRRRSSTRQPARATSTGERGLRRTPDRSNTLGVGVSFDLPFHDRNQGNIAHARDRRPAGGRDAKRPRARRRADRRRRTRSPRSRRARRSSSSTSPAISIRRGSRSTSPPTSFSAAPAACSISSTPSAPIATHSSRTARRWPRT